MTFKKSVETCLGPKYWFSFGGRASRSEFWWFILFEALVNMGAGMAGFLLPLPLDAALSFCVTLALLPAHFGVAVRRLHDRGLSGWWVLLPFGTVFALMSGRSGGVADLLALAIWLGYLLVLVLPGSPLPNRFGPPTPETMKSPARRLS